MYITQGFILWTKAGVHLRTLLGAKAGVNTLLLRSLPSWNLQVNMQCLIVEHLSANKAKAASM